MKYMLMVKQDNLRWLEKHRSSKKIKVLKKYQSSKKIKVETDPDRLRKADIPVLRGSNKKALREVDFAVRHKLADTLADTLEYWREQMSRESN